MLSFEARLLQRQLQLQLGRRGLAHLSLKRLDRRIPSGFSPA
jgi:hypothetical protein